MTGHGTSSDIKDTIPHHGMMYYNILCCHKTYCQIILYSISALENNPSKLEPFSGPKCRYCFSGTARKLHSDMQNLATCSIGNKRSLSLIF